MTKCMRLLIWLLFVSVTAQAADAVHEYHLKNGLRLLVKEDHRAPVAITEVWYKVGSSYEPNGMTGISHALEHMMFRGSKNYNAEQFLQTIATNGGQQNAFTFYDYTGYYEMMGADKLPIAFQLEADRMRNLSLRAEDFAKEIQVVKEERRMRIEDDPQQQTAERFYAAAFLSSPYHQPLIGWMHDLDNMTIEDLRAWYKTWYAPNNAIVVVVGDVDPEKVHQLAEQYFGSLQPSTIPQLKPAKEVSSLGEKIVNVSLPAKLPYLLMGYPVPVVKTATEKWQPYALMLLSGILEGSDSSRLEKNLVRGKQMATQIDLVYLPYFRLDTLFEIDALPATGYTAAQVQAAISKEIEKLQQQPVSEAELNRVKARMIANKIYQEDSIEYQAFEIGSLEVIGLSWREIENALQEIKKITPAQVQAVAKQYLIPQNLTVAIFHPLPMRKPAVRSPVSSSSKSYVQ